MRRMGLLHCSVVLLICLLTPVAIGQQLFTSTVISTSALPERFDDEITFHYLSSEVSPESLLSEISKSGILVARAWLALDNRCTDLIGPRFSVELTQPDSRIVEFGFAKGAGRLHCASRLYQYSITE